MKPTAVCFKSSFSPAFNFHNLLCILSSLPPHSFSKSYYFLLFHRNTHCKGSNVMTNELVFLIKIKDVGADSPTSVAIKGYICSLRPMPTLPCLCPSICRGTNGFRILVTFSDLSWKPNKEMEVVPFYFFSLFIIWQCPPPPCCPARDTDGCCLFQLARIASGSLWGF